MLSAILRLVTPASAAAPNVYQIQEGFVDAHGVMIYYVEMGHGSPLLVVHGGPGASHDYFLPWLLPLARTNRLIFIAHPDSNYDPTTDNAGMNWELYREMWGSDGEFVVDGNLKSAEYVDRLPTLKVPTLVICGDHDECDPSLSKEMHEKIAGSKLVILPNSGHLAFEDQPGLWIGSVRDFINGGSKELSKAQ